MELEPVLRNLSPQNILTIFASMLYERRICFVSSKLTTLSNLVQALVSFIYPFTWQVRRSPRALPRSRNTKLIRAVHFHSRPPEAVAQFCVRSNAVYRRNSHDTSS
jgi:hypothetical protein